MMMRSNSFVRNICIIWLLYFNCSLCSVSYVPTNSLFAINSINGTNVSNDARPLAQRNDDDVTLDYTHKTINNESSQQNAVDFVLLPNSVVNYREYQYENSKLQTAIDEPRQQHKRMAEPQDLCDSNECKCKLETKFLTVDCNFRQVSDFIFVYIPINPLFSQFSFYVMVLYIRFSH